MPITSRRLVGAVLRATLSRLPRKIRHDFFRVACDYVSFADKHRAGFPSVEGALTLARDSGFQPRRIIDIGAYVGEWSGMARRIFPDASVLMIDANPENESALRAAARNLGGDTKHVVALLGPDAREEVTLFQHQTGTSVLRELTTFQATQLKVPMVTLDALLEEDVGEPWLLKLDVQGFELEVLKGGAKTLSKSEVVLLEVSTLPFNENAPLFDDVIAFMASRGFRVFDLAGQVRRHSDEALFQVDVLFAREDSLLRRKGRFFFNEPL